jgi:hypothetical protein
MKRERYTKETFLEVGPRDRIPPKFLWIEPFLEFLQNLCGLSYSIG